MAIHATLYIAAPVERVWALLDEPENLPRWMPEVVETSDEGPGRGDHPVGSRFRQKIREGGRVKEYQGEVTAYDPGRRLGVRLGDRHFSVAVTYRLSQEGDATRLDYTCDMEQAGWLARAMAMLARPLSRRILARHMSNLKRVAESGPLSG